MEVKIISDSTFVPRLGRGTFEKKQIHSGAALAADQIRLLK
jgi:hypothetical protein